MENQLKNIMEKVKKYYELKQNEEKVKIKVKNFGAFRKYYFWIEDELDRELSLFSFALYFDKPGFVELQDKEGYNTFYDMTLLENKMHEIIDGRVKMLEKYNKIKQERKLINDIKKNGLPF